jgi:NAD(P)H dehydrogenase (quinone)
LVAFLVVTWTPSTEGIDMTKILVLYYSSYGHIERMAHEVAAGVEVAGAEADVKRVPETVPEEIARKSGFKLDQRAPIAKVEELAHYDAVVFGTPTRFGNMAGQMKNFLDQAGALWLKGTLIGKVGGVFTSSATQHGGQESTILTFLPVLMHLGFVIVGLPYAFDGQMGHSEVMGNSPYGSSTISGADGSRQPSRVELAGAHFQGKHIAEISARLRK